MDQNRTPIELGYRMPAEWERHESTWLSWPKDPLSFPDELLPQVEKTYLRIIGSLNQNEKVNLLVDDEKYEEKVIQLLESEKIKTDNVIIHKIKTQDVWFRDYGPIFLKKQSKNEAIIAFTHWGFNAWGDKYKELKQDSHIPEELALNIPCFRPDMVLEGGSIEMNGLGTCLTTEQCLLNPNRNPNLTKTQIEKNLSDYLGANNIIWLKDGITGDDTDGHVDDIARFVNKDTVVSVVEENKSDENHESTKTNLDILKNAEDQDGNKLNIIALPMPNAVIYKGQRLPASYANFFIANKTVLVPTFNDDNDKKALRILQKLFPDRKVIGINCRALVYGFGSIHCIAQQQPAVG